MAIRWLGPGALHINLDPTGNERIVVQPYNPDLPIEKQLGCNIRKKENLAAIGEKRIAQFIAEGKAITIPD